MYPTGSTPWHCLSGCLLLRERSASGSWPLHLLCECRRAPLRSIPRVVGNRRGAKGDSLLSMAPGGGGALDGHKTGQNGVVLVRQLKHHASFPLNQSPCCRCADRFWSRVARAGERKTWTVCVIHYLKLVEMERKWGCNRRRRLVSSRS